MQFCRVLPPMARDGLCGAHTMRASRCHRLSLHCSQKVPGKCITKKKSCNKYSSTALDFGWTVACLSKISKMHWVHESAQANIWDISRVWGSPCRTGEVWVGDKACQSLVEWSIGSSDVCRWKSRYQWDGSVVFWGILRFMGWQRNSPKMTLREQFPTFSIQSSVNRCVCTEWRGLCRYAL